MAVLSKKQLDRLARFRGFEYNRRMCAASAAQAERDAERLAKKLPAPSFRFRTAGDTDWQTFGDSGKLIVAFLKVLKREAR